MNRTGPLSGRLLFYSALLLAATMLALMLVPAKFWKQAEDGGTYEGFDPNLVYTQPKSSGALNEGEIKVTDSQLNLIALPASEPFAHLLTTPMSFDASMNLVVGENSEDSDPLRIGIWSVRNGSGYYLNFGPAPRNLVTAQLVKEKEIISEETLGTYSPDQIYQLQLSLDREKQEIKTQISGEPLPIPGNAIKLDGGPKDASYSDVFSDFFPVIPGQRYKYGGWLRPVVGSDTYKISLFWYDTQKEFISFSNSWLPVKHIKDWTRIELEAEAPPTAASARLFIGSGNGTSLLFAGLFAHRADSPNDLLINNGNFLNGLSGWNWHAGREGPASVSPSSLNASTVVTADQAPDIFESVRLSLTASASSSQEVSSATIDNYNLTLSPELPHVLVTKNGKLPVLVLAVAGILLGLWRSSLWLAERRARKPGSQLGAREGSQVMRVARPLLLGIGAAAAVYFIGNAALFGLGAHPFDVTSEKVWAYVGAKYNIFELYPLSSTVSLAKVWNGSPYHEAVFPYLATMAYYSTGIGWLYRIFLGGPGPLSMDGFGLEFLIKSGNVIFGFADAVLIVLILRRLGLKLNLALQSSALLLFNPALWINMSIWGETETISLFFLLFAIWRAESGSPQMSWISLGLAFLTRPQMIVPVAVLGLIYLRRFGPRETLQSASWAIVVCFILISPFLYHFSPSFLVDYAKLVANTHVANAGEPGQLAVSFSSYSFWPLVTHYAEGVSGLQRMYYLETSELAGGLSYGAISNLLVIGTLLGLATIILSKKASELNAGAYIPLLALTMLSWSMLTTGMLARYFLYALALIIASRASLRPLTYFSMVAVLTVTTFITIYGGLGYSIQNVPQLAPDLHSSSNIVTAFIMELMVKDWFITWGILANMAVLIWLAMDVLRPRLSWRRRREIVLTTRPAFEEL